MKNRIAELRKERGLTLKAMGKAVNLRDSTLSQYENDKRDPQLGVMQELASFFNVSLSYLLCETNKRDFMFENDDEALKLLRDLEKHEINTDEFSMESKLTLSLWIMNHDDYFSEGSTFSSLASTASSFVRQVSSENSALKLYRQSKKSDDAMIQAIIEKLEDDEFGGVTPEQVTRFMNAAQNKSHEDVEKALKYLEQFPNYKIENL